VADAMEPLWQDVEQEAPDELVRRERRVGWRADHPWLPVDDALSADSGPLSIDSISAALGPVAEVVPGGE
jgi:hypothetical protein